LATGHDLRHETAGTGNSQALALHAIRRLNSQSARQIDAGSDLLIAGENWGATLPVIVAIDTAALRTRFIFSSLKIEYAI
jgi:hypothetical protein